MKLTQLEPQFVRYETRPEIKTFVICGQEHVHTAACRRRRKTVGVYHVFVDNLAEAQGVRFLCPKCFAANAGPRGTHGVACWSRSRGVPDAAHPRPGRWTLDGTGYGDLTLNGDPPGNARSVAITSGCMAHFHVTGGEVTGA